MVSSTRKRGRQEMEASSPPAATTSFKTEPKEQGLLHQLRNMWQFANLGQYIFTFGKAVKLDEDLDIEELEIACLQPGAPKLKEIGLALLKFVSSHRGLTLDIFDEYTRRQYVAKAPHRNVFGVDEEPAHFNDFDIFTKIKVLQQLSVWTFNNADRIRGLMEEQKDSEQAYWRIEPLAWDSEDRSYIVLDDNRLYRQTDAPPPPKPKATPKKNSKKARAALRASKRRKMSQATAESEHDEEAEDSVAVSEDAPVEDDGLGGAKWECLAITLDEYNSVLASFDKTRDENEKVLCKRLVKEVLPLLEKQEESRKRKQAQKERELANLEKMAHAKRSSRLASKMEHKREEEERRAAEEKHRQELAMAKKEQEKWKKLEKERESRMQTREQRLKEREARRILHEEELANLSENGKKLEEGDAARLSERNLKAAIDKNKKALEELENLDEDWVFDCICGAYGQIDDGSLSVECEKCKVWQHAKCLGISEAQLTDDAFHFICSTCKRKEKEAEEAKNRPQSGITIKFGQPSGSPAQQQSTLPAANGSPIKQHAQRSSSPVKQPQAQRNIQSSPTRSPYQAYQASSNILPPIRYANGQNGDIARPVSQGSTPVAPQWSNQQFNGNRQTPARLQLGGHLQQSPFSSPHPHSPTSLPPPVPQYGFVGNGQGHPPVGGFAAAPSSPAPGAAQNGYQGLGFQIPRRTSVSFPSPLAGAPINGAGNGAGNVNSNGNTGPILPPLTQQTPVRPPSNPASSYTTPAQVTQTPSAPYSTASNGTGNGMLHFSAGISPVKHSPPLRPSTAENQRVVSGGSFGLGASFGTPAQIPQAVKLNPSPGHVDLTPPVKRVVSGASVGGGSFGGPLPGVQTLAAEGAQNGDAPSNGQGQVQAEGSTQN